MNNNNQLVLIIAKEEPLLTVMTYNLSRYGYVVNSSPNITNSFSSIEIIQPTIVLLDEEIIGNISIIEAITLIKSKLIVKNTPIIILSKTKIDIENIRSILGENIDFIQKPFVPSSLVSTIKSFTVKSSQLNRNNILHYNNIKMNIDSFQVVKNGKKVHLGPTEFKILQCLMELPGKTLTREHIMSYVWGHNFQIEPRTIDVHINRLRTALKDDEDNSIIKTVRSAGYCLENA